MTQLDWLISRRIGSRVFLVVLVFFGLIGLAESLDTWRYNWLTEHQGPGFGLLAILMVAARWSIKILPVTVLIGAIIALLDLQAHRELIIIRASGISVWRTLRGPILFTVAGGLLMSLVADGWVTRIDRGILPVPRAGASVVGGPDQIWLEQQSSGGHYIVQATRGSTDSHVLSNATFFMAPGLGASRITAETATLISGMWLLENATLIGANDRPRLVDSYSVETTSTRADLELALSTSDDFTFFELRKALAIGLADPTAQAVAAMRYAKLLAQPALLVGSLLIAFAFTAGYRRTSSYGSAILYGIVLGFVVFVITEMADRAGSAGVLDPTLAAWGPGLVAIVIGTTVLLRKEDGRA